MNRVSSHNEGYTIFETLIFLAVTGALFASTITMVSGQQAKTEFIQAVKDVQTQIQDVANDVSTGFYHNPATLKCQAVGSPPRPNVTNFVSDTQGENEECIFLGRSLQFAPTSGSTIDQINVYNIAGVRQTAAGAEVKDFSEAVPTAMAKGAVTNTSTPNDALNTINLQSGLTVAYVRYIHNGIPTNVSGFAYMSTLAQYSLGVIASGSLSMDIYPIGAPTLPPAPDKPALNFVDDINQLNLGTLQKNPNGGMKICFDSGGGNQHAIFSFGIDKKMTPVVEIKNGSCI